MSLEGLGRMIRRKPTLRWQLVLRRNLFGRGVYFAIEWSDGASTMASQRFDIPWQHFNRVAEVASAFHGDNSVDWTDGPVGVFIRGVMGRSVVGTLTADMIEAEALLAAVGVTP